MKTGALPIISYLKLSLSFLPALIVIGILYRWSLRGGEALYALARMLIQLLLIGYVLTFIFESEHSWVVVGVLCTMLLAASWISLRPMGRRQPRVFAKALLSISVGGLLVLALITQVVIDLPRWYQPQYMIPLAGMIFSNSMNSVSLAGERFWAEKGQGNDYVKARGAAMNAALLPLINSLFAVGLVALPGMMTGQILSGIDPLIAVRYQVMVMCMIFGAAGISSAVFLSLQER